MKKQKSQPIPSFSNKINLIVLLTGALFIPVAAGLTFILAKLFITVLEPSLFNGPSGLALALILVPLIKLSGFVFAGLLAGVALYSYKTRNALAITIVGTTLLYWVYRLLIIQHDLTHLSWLVMSLVAVTSGMFIFFTSFMVFELIEKMRSTKMVAIVTTAVVLLGSLILGGTVQARNAEYDSPANQKIREVSAMPFTPYEPTYVSPGPSTGMTYNGSDVLSVAELTLSDGYFTLYEFAPSEITAERPNILKGRCLPPAADGITVARPESTVLCNEVATLASGDKLYMDPTPEYGYYKFYAEYKGTYFYISYDSLRSTPFSNSTVVEVTKIMNSLKPIDKSRLLD